MNITSGHYLLFLNIPVYLYLIHECQFWTLSAILEHSKMKFMVDIDSSLVCSMGPKQNGVFFIYIYFMNINCIAEGIGILYGIRKCDVMKYDVMK